MKLPITWTSESHIRVLNNIGGAELQKSMAFFDDTLPSVYVGDTNFTAWVLPPNAPDGEEMYGVFYAGEKIRWSIANKFKYKYIFVDFIEGTLAKLNPTRISSVTEVPRSDMQAVAAAFINSDSNYFIRRGGRYASRLWHCLLKFQTIDDERRNVLALAKDTFTTYLKNFHHANNSSALILPVHGLNIVDEYLRGDENLNDYPQLYLAGTLPQNARQRLDVDDNYNSAKLAIAYFKGEARDMQIISKYYEKFIIEIAEQVRATSDRYVIRGEIADSINRKAEEYALACVNEIYSHPPLPVTEEEPVVQQAHGVRAAAGDAQVTVSWSSLPRAQAYRLEYSEYPDGPWTIILAETPLTSHTHPGLTNGSVYYYRIAGIDAKGVAGAASASVPCIPMPPLPDAVNNLVAAASHQAVTLTWSTPTTGGAPERYKVEYREYLQTEYTVASDSVAHSTTSYTVGGLQNGARYYFRISAINAAGTGEPSSDTVSSPIARPGAIYGFRATSGDNQVVLQWNTPSGGGDVESFEIQKKLETDADYIVAVTGLAADLCTYTITGLTNNVEYIFLLKCINSGGFTYATVNATPAETTAPGAITGLSATAAPSSAKISWTAPTTGGDVESYTIHYRLTADTSSGAGTTIEDVTAAATNYTLSGLTGGSDYTIAVTPINAAGNGPSATATVTPRVGVVPGPVLNLSATATATGADITWDVPTAGGGAVDQYSINYKQTSDTGAGTTVIEPDPTKTSASISGLVAATEYTITVTAQNAAGDSPVSTITVTPLPSARAVGNLSALAHRKSVKLSWTAVAGDPSSTKYRVDYRLTSGTDADYKHLSPDHPGVSRSISGLTSGESYIFRVRIINDDGSFSTSRVIIATPT